MLDQAHMTSLFENATEGIILTDAGGNIVVVNPAAEKIFGYRVEELRDKPIEILIPDKFKHSHQRHRSGFYDDPGNRVMGAGRDLYGRHKNGHEIPVEISLSHYRRDNSLFVIAFIVDITTRKEIEMNMVRQRQELEHVTQQIKKLNAELEIKVEQRTTILKEALQKLEKSQQELSAALDKERQLNEIKSRFVSMASHEFRTPLSTVLSSASLLEKYVQTDEQSKREKHINRIKGSVKHLNDILEDFLSLGKLDEGKVEANFSAFNLKESLNDISEELRGLLKPGQKINMQYKGDEEIISDKKLLKNILFNLLTNASKFSDNDKLIQITATAENGRCKIRIADQGIGIADQDKQHLFSSFFRGANAINITGTGLGLHIVKRYADLLGGNVQLESILHEGTTVTIDVPVHKTTNDEIHISN